MPVPLPSTLVELEKSIEVAAQIAAREYGNAIKHLQEYANDVKTVVDRVIEHNDHTVWSTLKNKTSARDTAVEAAERSAQEARAQLEKLEKHVANVAKDVAPEVLEKTRRNIRVISDQLNKSKDDLYNAKDSANLSEKYWKKVEEARNYFVDQVQTLFPGVDLSAKKLNLDKSDVDLLVMHAYSHVLAYQKELQKMHAEGEIRLRRALDALKGEDQSEAVNRQLEYLLAKEKQELNIENQKKIFRIQAESEAKLRQQLKNQSEAHADHLEDAVLEKEKELRRIFNRELNDKLTVEQATYKLQLATTLGKLRGMDSALKGNFNALIRSLSFPRNPHTHTPFGSHLITIVFVFRCANINWNEIFVEISFQAIEEELQGLYFAHSLYLPTMCIACDSSCVASRNILWIARRSDWKSRFSFWSARADADRQVHQAQALWSACAALWSSMRTVDPTVPWQEQLRPLSNEVEAVKRASGEHLSSYRRQA